MCHEWDTGSGISFSTSLGERNNNTLPLTSLVTGMNPANIVNQGHLDRVIDRSLNIKTIMDTWTLKKGI